MEFIQSEYYGSADPSKTGAAASKDAVCFPFETNSRISTSSFAPDQSCIFTLDTTSTVLMEHH